MATPIFPNGVFMTWSLTSPLKKNASAVAGFSLRTLTKNYYYYFFNLLDEFSNSWSFQVISNIPSCNCAIRSSQDEGVVKVFTISLSARIRNRILMRSGTSRKEVPIKTWYFKLVLRNHDTVEPFIVSAKSFCAMRSRNIIRWVYPYITCE